MKNRDHAIGLFQGMFERNILTESGDTTTGPASFVAVDPDGNPILVDEHV